MEIKTTGFMSNRGRQNVASFLTSSLSFQCRSLLTDRSILVEDLQVDWRAGAEFFESNLIDHEVCSFTSLALLCTDW